MGLVRDDADSRTAAVADGERLLTAAELGEGRARRGLPLNSPATHDPVDLLLATLRLGPTPDLDHLASGWRSIALRGFPQLLQYEGCEAWLYRRLSDLALLDQVDTRLADWLTRRARLVAAHNILVDTQRDALVECLNRCHTPHVLLKGAAYRLLADRLPYIDARMTGDVDVLLPGDLARSAWDRLRREGFDVASTRPDAFFEKHHHLSPLWGPRRVPLELHTSTAKAVPPAEAWRRMYGSGREVNCPRGPTRVPSTTDLFWHAVSHAHSHPRQLAFRLRFLQDAAAILASGEAINWQTVAARLETSEHPYPMVARRWIHAAGRLAGRPGIEDGLTNGVQPYDLHRALSWRLHVLRGLRSDRQVWSPNAFARDPLGRARRFAITVGSATDLGLVIPHVRLRRTSLRRAAARIGCALVQMGYGAWKQTRGWRTNGERLDELERRKEAESGEERAGDRS